MTERQRPTPSPGSTLDMYLTFIKPTCVPAQTSYDHEEWARFYLSCLTDPEYLKRRGDGNLNGLGPNPFLWSDSELISKARQHAEAARILKELDELHSDDTPDTDEE